MKKKIIPFFLILLGQYNIIMTAILSITNKTNLELWIGCETTHTCTEQNDFFTASGKKLALNEVGSFSLSMPCTPKSLRIFTQNPTNNPGKPIVISLYGQISSLKRDHFFNLELTPQGKFVLKRSS